MTHEETASNVRLYVGGLPPDISVQELRQRFSPFGEVKGVNLVPSKRTPGLVDSGPSHSDGGRPSPCRGFAYVDLRPKSEGSLAACLSTYNGCRFRGGGRLRIEQAKERYIERLKREWGQSTNEGHSQLGGPSSVEGEGRAGNGAGAPLEGRGPGQSMPLGNGLLLSALSGGGGAAGASWTGPGQVIAAGGRGPGRMRPMTIQWGTWQHSKQTRVVPACGGSMNRHKRSFQYMEPKLLAQLVVAPRPMTLLSREGGGVSCPDLGGPVKRFKRDKGSGDENGGTGQLPLSGAHGRGLGRGQREGMGDDLERLTHSGVETGVGARSRAASNGALASEGVLVQVVDVSRRVEEAAGGGGHDGAGARLDGKGLEATGGDDDSVPKEMDDDWARVFERAAAAPKWDDDGSEILSGSIDMKVGEGQLEQGAEDDNGGEREGEEEEEGGRSNDELEEEKEAEEDAKFLRGSETTDARGWTETGSEVKSELELETESESELESDDMLESGEYGQLPRGNRVEAATQDDWTEALRRAAEMNGVEGWRSDGVEGGRRDGSKVVGGSSSSEMVKEQMKEAAGVADSGKAEGSGRQEIGSGMLRRSERVSLEGEASQRGDGQDDDDERQIGDNDVLRVEGRHLKGRGLRNGIRQGEGEEGEEKEDEVEEEGEGVEEFDEEKKDGGEEEDDEEEAEEVEDEREPKEEGEAGAGAVEESLGHSGGEGGSDEDNELAALLRKERKAQLVLLGSMFPSDAAFFSAERVSPVRRALSKFVATPRFDPTITSQEPEDVNRRLPGGAGSCMEGETSNGHQVAANAGQLCLDKAEGEVGEEEALPGASGQGRGTSTTTSEKFLRKGRTGRGMVERPTSQALQGAAIERKENRRTGEADSQLMDASTVQPRFKEGISSQSRGQGTKAEERLTPKQVKKAKGLHEGGSLNARMEMTAGFGKGRVAVQAQGLMTEETGVVGTVREGGVETKAPSRSFVSPGWRSLVGLDGTASTFSLTAIRGENRAPQAIQSRSGIAEPQPKGRAEEFGLVARQMLESLVVEECIGEETHHMMQTDEAPGSILKPEAARTIQAAVVRGGRSLHVVDTVEASAFMRRTSAEEEWRASRDSLSLDYKRKRKQAWRRGGHLTKGSR